jgi:hypothetical protein
MFLINNLTHNLKILSFNSKINLVISKTFSTFVFKLEKQRNKKK